MPSPGPQDYAPEATKPYKPAYTMRLKLDPKGLTDDNPGPGHYDIDDSTIGNWGAGMAAHIPADPDASLAERIDAFGAQRAALARERRVFRGE